MISEDLVLDSEESMVRGILLLEEGVGNKGKLTFFMPKVWKSFRQRGCVIEHGGANADLIHRDLGRGALCLSGIFLGGHCDSVVERLLRGGWEMNAQVRRWRWELTEWQ